MKAEPGEEPARKQEEEEAQAQLKAEPGAEPAQKQEEEEAQTKPMPGEEPTQKQEEKEAQAKPMPGDEPARKQEEKEAQARPMPGEDPVRKRADEEPQTKPIPNEEPAQKQDEAEIVQRKAGAPVQASAEVQHRLHLSKGKGERLPAGLQERFGQVFGADFSQVHIHTREEAVALCRDLGAQAFTHGRDIYFNQGRFNPDTAEGRHLLAHELSHSIQQGVAPLVAPRSDPEAAKRALEDGVADATPSTIEGLNEFKSEGKVVGNEMAASVTADVNQVKGTYSAIENPPPPVPLKTPEPLLSSELVPPTPPLNLGRNVVPKLTEEHTDFSQYEKESDDLLEKEGVTQGQLDMVDSGELAEANQERTRLSKEVSEQPAAMQQLAQDEATQVDRKMVREEGKVRDATKAKRDQDLNATANRQQAVKTELQLKEQEVAREINGIYEAAKTRVTKKLETLETESLKRFDEGQAGFAVQFEQEVNDDVEDWKDERYSGLFAGVKWLKDKLVGIDHFPEIQRAFSNGRERFVRRLDRLLLDINRDNETVIRECKEDLAQARKDIDEHVKGLDPALTEAGLKAQTDMEAKLNQLDGFIEEKKKALQEKLCEAKEAAIEAIDKKIEEMKASMSGVVGKLGALLLNAALKFFEWALEKAGFNPAGLMKTIRKGVAVIKKIVRSPIELFKNLAAAVGAGIQGFVTRIRKYLIQGLVEWLTGSLGEAGLTLPEKFDLRGIFSLVLQILGLTWANIRQKLVNKLGEKVVAGLEKTSDVVKRIVVDGPIALWEMIKDKATEVKQKVMEGIRNWTIVNVVKQAAIKLAMMLNPAGAIVQAIISIYNLVMFFVDNIKRIIDFAKSIINSIAKIASGAISAAADFIEKAMGRTVPIILSFVARLFSLGGIGKAVKNVVATVRKPVDKVLDRVVAFVAKLAGKVVGKAKGAAKKVGGKVKDASKKVVAKLVGWWNKRTPFKGGGKSHSLFLKGNKLSGSIMVASDEKTLDKFLKENKPTGKEGESKLATTYGEALAWKKKVEE